jgi:hypothetical protein
MTTVAGAGAGSTGSDYYVRSDTGTVLGKLTKILCASFRGLSAPVASNCTESGMKSGMKTEEAEDRWHWICRSVLLAALTVPNFLYSYCWQRDLQDDVQRVPFTDADLFLSFDTYRLVAGVSCAMAYITFVCDGSFGRVCMGFVVFISVGAVMFERGLRLPVDSG